MGMPKLSDEALNKIKNRIAMVLAGYSKRYLEDVYNRAFHTTIGQRLKNMPRAAIFSTELALYLLNALLVERLRDDTPLMKLLSEIITDAPSEISKRLINGEAELADLENLFRVMTPEKQEEVIKGLLAIGGQSLINKKLAVPEQNTENETNKKPLSIAPTVLTVKPAERPFSTWAQETTVKLHAKRDEIRRKRQERGS